MAATQAVGGGESMGKAATTTLLTNLPPELKNRIYDLVLVTPGEPIYINQAENRKKRGRGLKHASTKGRRGWQEPALLTVSKAVREEALPQYYGSNAFVIPLFMQDILEAAFWLAFIMVETGTATSFLSLTFVVHGDAWILLEHFRPMVNLAREYGQNFARATGKEVTVKDAGAPRPPTLEMSRNSGQYITRAFTSLLQLGHTAYEEVWTEAYLDLEFLELVEQHEETPGGKAAGRELVRWNRNIRMLDRVGRRVDLAWFAGLSDEEKAKWTERGLAPE